MNNYYRFYQAVWVERVKALSTSDLYKAVTGMYLDTSDDDLSNAVADLAYRELTHRGEMRPRGSATMRKLVRLAEV